MKKSQDEFLGVAEAKLMMDKSGSLANDGGII